MNNYYENTFDSKFEKFRTVQTVGLPMDLSKLPKKLSNDYLSYKPIVMLTKQQQQQQQQQQQRGNMTESNESEESRSKQAILFDLIRSNTNFTLLNKIDLSNCNLLEFPSELICISSYVTMLNFGGNKISKLPDDIISFQSLRILFFANNNFESFPEVLSNLQSLYMVFNIYHHYFIFLKYIIYLGFIQK